MTTRLPAAGAVVIALLATAACSKTEDTASPASDVPPATAGMDDATATGTTAKPQPAPGTSSTSAPAADAGPPASGDRADSNTSEPATPSPTPKQ
ncbi:MAG: hypothetical protein KA105_07865 [Caulobacter sp.]|nr:hypothetical protein [Caulobacter sp.]